jgi:glucokinase
MPAAGPAQPSGKRIAAISTIGCDIGGSALKIVRLRRLRIIESLEIPNRRETGPREFVDLLAKTFARLEGDAIGVAVPGFLDARRRKIVRLSNLPALDGLTLASRLERRLGRPVILDADTNAGAVGEARLGVARGVDRVLYVTLGTGLGAALAVGGVPVRVSRHTVGQIASIPLGSRREDEAERLLSAKGILRRYRRAGGSRRVASALELYRRARDGDETALSTWRETGDLLGSLLRTLVPLLQPDVVVIGGGVAGASDLFLGSARRLLRRSLPRDGNREIPLSVAKLARLSGAVGAALLARDA